MDIDELITQGETLRVSLKKVESRWRSWYEYANHGAFQEWVQKTTRFLHTHYRGDIMIEEFEKIVESEQNRNEVIGFFQKQHVDFSHIVILTKSQILEDIVGDNHNVELPKIDKPKVNVAEMALQLGKL